MIISHKHKFVFIKTFKTASTSIEVWLSPYVGDDAIVTPIFPPHPSHHPRNCPPGFHDHMPAVMVRDYFSGQGWDWDGYFKFAIERNPWDKTLSHYFHVKHHWEHEYGTELSFDDYMSMGIMPVAWPLYTDSGGEVIVRQIASYEYLPQSLSRISVWTGAPLHNIPVLKSKFRSRRAHRGDMYTHNSKSAVADAFQFEINLLGYEFDQPSGCYLAHNF